MVWMETAGSITTQRSRAEDAFVIIVLQTAEETFIVTALFIGRSTLSVDNGTVQFCIILRKHLRLAGSQEVITVIIIFVPQKDVEVIVTKRTGIRNKLLQVVIVSTCMILAHCTSGGVKLSVVGIVHVRKACLIQVESTIECHLQAFYRSYIYKGVGVNGISFRVSGI